MSEFDVYADEQDLQDLNDALAIYVTMFGAEPSNIAEIRRSTYRNNVLHHTECLYEIRALAHKAWVENDRQPLPDDVGPEVAQHAERVKTGDLL